MSWKVRSLLVLVVGTVLGLTVSFGAHVLAAREARARSLSAHEIPGEYLEVLAEVMERVRREYVDQIDDRQLIESAIRGSPRPWDRGCGSSARTPN